MIEPLIFLDWQPPGWGKIVQLNVDCWPVLVVGSRNHRHASILEGILRQERIPVSWRVQDGRRDLPELWGGAYDVAGMGWVAVDGTNLIVPLERQYWSEDYGIGPNLEYLAWTQLYIAPYVIRVVNT